MVAWYVNRILLIFIDVANIPAFIFLLQRGIRIYEHQKLSVKVLGEIKSTYYYVCVPNIESRYYISMAVLHSDPMCTKMIGHGFSPLHPLQLDPETRCYTKTDQLKDDTRTFHNLTSHLV